MCDNYRDIYNRMMLPDFTNDFTAYTQLASALACHYALRGRNDGNTHPGKNPWDFLFSGIYTPAWSADALQPSNHCSPLTSFTPAEPNGRVINPGNFDMANPTHM